MNKLIRIYGLMTLGFVAAACIAVAEENKELSGEKGKKEETVALADLPAAVRTTIDKEIPGAKIEKIEKEDKDGKVHLMLAFPEPFAVGRAC